jgi:hypothetical protein
VDTLTHTAQGGASQRQFQRSLSFYQKQKATIGSQKERAELLNFTHALLTSPDVRTKLDSETDDLVDTILDVGRLTDPVGSTENDRRRTKIPFELLCRRMVDHMRVGLTKKEQAPPSEHSEQIQMSILLVLRRAVERLEVTEELEDQYTETELKLAREKYARMQDSIDRYGGGVLVVDIISEAPDNDLYVIEGTIHCTSIHCTNDLYVIEALKFGIAILNGGNETVQVTVWTMRAYTVHAYIALAHCTHTPYTIHHTPYTIHTTHHTHHTIHHTPYTPHRCLYSTTCRENTTASSSATCTNGCCVRSAPQKRWTD